ncbi:hypothetical protein L484_026390 [Morus notabilis]|uniref:Uncharacterized protein n=1 Tax=Morus notabilis TaxID=981085 RepID=W9RL82_9ROSA|nr:hypothetical protein L484_026390 [Morus notabilis]
MNAASVGLWFKFLLLVGDRKTEDTYIFCKFSLRRSSPQMSPPSLSANAAADRCSANAAADSSANPQNHLR